MSDDPDHGGDISSGFGESTVTGRVSDEKAEKMLHGDPPAPTGGAEGTSESDAPDLAQK